MLVICLGAEMLTEAMPEVFHCRAVELVARS